MFSANRQIDGRGRWYTALLFLASAPVGWETAGAAELSPLQTFQPIIKEPAPTTTTESRLQAPERLIAPEVLTPLQPLPETSPSPGSTAPEPQPPEPQPPEGTFDNPDSSTAAPSAPAAPGSYGSLMGRTLPPPPSVPPAAHGAGDDGYEPAEVMAISPDMGAAQALAQQVAPSGFGVKRRRRLTGIGLVVTVLRVPQGMEVEQALEMLRSALPEAWFDANHRYDLHGGLDPKRYPRKLILWPSASPGCGKGAHIGVIDTRVDDGHPALRGRHLTQRSFLTPGIEPAEPEHGTAVATLLVGAANGSAPGLLPEAQVSLAAVFRRRAGGEIDTTAELVILALDWLVERKVSVINLSFGGPRNLALEMALRRIAALGVPVAAAAGNSGADGDPVYPAAQEQVIAVTAIDAARKPYEEANRGDYIAFAAPGVDVWSAKAGGGGKYFSGTSYAVPYMSATIAAMRLAAPKKSSAAILRAVTKKAVDLGEPGRDRVFGWGLIQAPSACQKR